MPIYPDKAEDHLLHEVPHCPISFKIKPRQPLKKSQIQILIKEINLDLWRKSSRRPSSPVQEQACGKLTTSKAHSLATLLAKRPKQNDQPK